MSKLPYGWELSEQLSAVLKQVHCLGSIARLIGDEGTTRSDLLQLCHRAHSEGPLVKDGPSVQPFQTAALIYKVVQLLLNFAGPHLTETSSQDYFYMRNLKRKQDLLFPRNICHG